MIGFVEVVGVRGFPKDMCIPLIFGVGVLLTPTTPFARAHRRLDVPTFENLPLQ
jgi:hypothetical protein